jgi:hypothetical protein
MISSKSSSVRRRLTCHQRQRLLTRFHKGQLTQRDFANRHRIGLSTLSKWLRCEDKTTLPPLKFQAVTLPNSPLRYAMELVRGRTLPQGMLGKAIDYALRRWEALTRFESDGVLEIDSNLIENSIRPSALGKKNFLFFGHPEAGERSAVIYTLLGSCRRHGVNPFDYLSDLFTHLPAAKLSQIKEFTPGMWARSNAKEKVAA